MGSENEIVGMISFVREKFVQLAYSLHKLLPDKIDKSSLGDKYLSCTVHEIQPSDMSTIALFCQLSCVKCPDGWGSLGTISLILYSIFTKRLSSMSPNS